MLAKEKLSGLINARAVVTGLGVTDPPQSEEEQRIVFEKKIP